MGFKVALASRDGLTVADHFGFADIYQIYEINKDGYTLLQAREVTSPRTSGEGHGLMAFSHVVMALSDVDAVVVAKIGNDAAGFVMKSGIRVFTAAGDVGEILNSVSKNLNQKR